MLDLREFLAAGGDGNDWFRANYDSKAKSVSDMTDGRWTRHSESKSMVHEDVKQESDGNPLRTRKQTVTVRVRGRKGCVRRPKRRELAALQIWPFGVLRLVTALADFAYSRRRRAVRWGKGLSPKRGKAVTSHVHSKLGKATAAGRQRRRVACARRTSSRCKNDLPCWRSRVRLRASDGTPRGVQ